MITFVKPEMATKLGVLAGNGELIFPSDFTCDCARGEFGFLSLPRYLGVLTGRGGGSFGEISNVTEIDKLPLHQNLAT